MKLTTVESSAIYAVGYDPKTKTMDVVFFRTGVHRFSDVPAKVFREFLASDSLGSYYGLFLENEYHERAVK